jgi:hypothetical protein
MEGTKVGAVHLVDMKYAAAPVIRRWRETLPDDQQNSYVSNVNASRLLPKSRSYKCEVVGVSGIVTLSSKSLAHVHASGSRT